MRWGLAILAVLSTLLPSVTAATAWPACTKPAVRKDWRALTKDEKANWISAVKCLAKMPRRPEITLRTPEGTALVPPYNKSGSYYDDFVYVHMDIANDVHGTPFFFPWHRWFVQVYENVLKQYCNLTTTSPYWDWSKENDVKNSAMFTDLDSISGLGGWGDPKDDFQVPNGGFREGFHLSYPVYHRLRREYTQLGRQNPQRPGTPANFAPDALATIVKGSPGNFSTFQNSIENGAHGTGHTVVGGDLAGDCPAGVPNRGTGACGGPFWTANEPVFWLHHGMVDKVWWDWQKANPSNALAFGGRSVRGSTANYTLDAKMPHSGLGPEITVRDIMNTTSGFQCFVYE